MQNAWEPQTQEKVHLFTVPTVWAGGGLEQGRRQVLESAWPRRGRRNRPAPLGEGLAHAQGQNLALGPQQSSAPSRRGANLSGAAAVSLGNSCWPLPGKEQPAGLSGWIQCFCHQTGPTTRLLISAHCPVPLIVPSATPGAPGRP